MIGACAGNAMHVTSIAVAILLGIAFVADMATGPQQGGASGGGTSQGAKARANNYVTKVRVAHLRGGVTPNLKRRRVESASATACESFFGSWSFVVGGPAHARLEKLDRPHKRIENVSPPGRVRYRAVILAFIFEVLAAT
jgi:hypothetical protein